MQRMNQTLSVLVSPGIIPSIHSASLAVVDRKAEFFHATVGANNGGGAVWQPVTVAGAGARKGSVNGNGIFCWRRKPRSFFCVRKGVS